MKIMMVLVLAANDADSGVSGNDFWAFGNGNGNRQPIAVSDISVYICLIDIRDGSCKPVYGGVDRLKALSSAKTGCRSRFFMN